MKTVTLIVEGISEQCNSKSVILIVERFNEENYNIQLFRKLIKQKFWFYTERKVHKIKNSKSILFAI